MKVFLALNVNLGQFLVRKHMADNVTSASNIAGLLQEKSYECLSSFVIRSKYTTGCSKTLGTSCSYKFSKLSKNVHIYFWRVNVCWGMWWWSFRSTFVLFVITDLNLLLILIAPILSCFGRCISKSCKVSSRPHGGGLTAKKSVNL